MWPGPPTGKLGVRGVVLPTLPSFHFVAQTFPRGSSLDGCDLAEELKEKLVTWYLVGSGYVVGGALKGKEKYQWPNAYMAEEVEFWGIPIPCANVRDTPEHRIGAGGQCIGDISKGYG